jgi:hypothetical protein
MNKFIDLLQSQMETEAGMFWIELVSVTQVEKQDHFVLDDNDIEAALDTSSMEVKVKKLRAQEALLNAGDSFEKAAELMFVDEAHRLQAFLNTFKPTSNRADLLQLLMVAASLPIAAGGLSGFDVLFSLERLMSDMSQYNHVRLQALAALRPTFTFRLQGAGDIDDNTEAAVNTIIYLLRPIVEVIKYAVN